MAEHLSPVLDVGCGDGELPRHLPNSWPWAGVDRSPTMLERAPKPAVLADARALPFADESFGAVAMLWMLYHLPDPETAVAEARRVLKPGGLLMASTNSQFDSPELAHVHSIGVVTFNAENAPDIVGRHFEEVELDPWDAPLVHLPDRAAVRDYLVGRLMPRPEAEAAVERVDTPLDVTKRGVLVFARKVQS
ncbi:MAG: class I SAM-dependent methyltransferase [Acidimicrobiia bacterium]|nr:class I SAM-dependent methyltransferase [Acidimicrobiia bacterium]